MRHFHWILIGGLVIGAALIGIMYYWSPHADLNITAGQPGSSVAQVIQEFKKVAESDHPRVKVVLVPTAGLEGNQTDIETGKVDLGIVRSDQFVPTNGATIAILQRDVLAFIVPHTSDIDKIADLAGHTVAIPVGVRQTYNANTLSTIAGFYNLSKGAVKTVFVPMTDIGAGLRSGKYAAVLAVGPIGAGEVQDAVSAITKAEGRAPKLLAVDEADAINDQFPGIESIDVPPGAFRGAPPVPDDTVTMLAITYRFVAPNSMPNVMAELLEDSLMNAKSRMVADTSAARGLEAPDPDVKNGVPPIHPGVAAALSGSAPSFFDEFQQLFYVGGMAITLAGSLTALILGRLHRARSVEDMRQIDQLIQVADKALTADAATLRELEQQLHQTIGWFARGKTSGEVDAAAFQVAISHAQHAIRRRQDELGVTVPAILRGGAATG